MEHRIQPVDVQETVTAVLQMVEPQLAAKRLDSVGDVPSGMRVLADPDKLSQILLTLLSNAIKYTDRGGYVMVDVGFPIGGPEDMVMIRVADNGCGIPRAKQDEIFELLGQPQRSQSVSAAGIEHGLPVSRVIAREMGGDLRVRSDEGQGSVFTVSLPRA